MNEVVYLIDGQIKKTATSNEDIIIDSKTEGSRNIVTVKALKPLILKRAYQNLSAKFDKESRFFLNGYQSWTDTKEFLFSEKEKNIYKLPKMLVNMFSFDKYGDAPFYSYRNSKLHGYDIFYIKGKDEFFSFNNNYKNAYLIYEIFKKEKVLALTSDVDNKFLDINQEYTVMDYFVYKSIEEGLKAFNLKFPKRNLEKVFGYTSWYNYYQDINSDIILRDLDSLDERFNLFQIDDGYETFVGDWLDVDKNKFPEGLEPIVKKTHDKGYKAGIWLAPFVAEEKSKLFTEHKELFKKVNGEYVKCGSNWSGFYALDFENEEARAYIKKSLEYFMDLGFDFFKLDFLYGISLAPYKGKTRSEVAEEAYEFIRSILKDKLILGCGATLANAISRFDYLRIGPDVSLKFDDIWYMKFMHRERISTKVTLQNTVYRSIFNDRFFGNDPDVFLLRKENISLSHDQKVALVLINALFGSVLMTSDNIADYDIDASGLLEEAFDIFYHATDVSYYRAGKYIDIFYRLNGKEKRLVYNTKKGVMTYGR